MTTSKLEKSNITYPINSGTKCQDVGVSHWIEQTYQLRNDADTKTALPDSNIIIVANKIGLLPVVLSLFKRIKMNHQIIFKEIEPVIGNDVKLFLDGQRENLEISYNSVSEELNNLSIQGKKLNAETSDSDTIITAMTVPSNSSATYADKLICQNNKGEEFTFSPHSLKHLGDGYLVCQTAIIGRDQSFVLTDEKKILNKI